MQTIRVQWYASAGTHRVIARLTPTTNFHYISSK
jgi:hypothetical protein